MGGAVVLITQNFDPSKNWMDKIQLSEIFTAKRCGSLNAAIFTASASTEHKSLKIMF